MPAPCFPFTLPHLIFITHTLQHSIYTLPDTFSHLQLHNLACRNGAEIENGPQFHLYLVCSGAQTPKWQTHTHTHTRTHIHSLHYRDIVFCWKFCPFVIYIICLPLHYVKLFTELSFSAEVYQFIVFPRIEVELVEMLKLLKCLIVSNIVLIL